MLPCNILLPSLFLSPLCCPALLLLLLLMKLVSTQHCCLHVANKKRPAERSALTAATSLCSPRQHVLFRRWRQQCAMPQKPRAALLEKNGGFSKSAKWPDSLMVFGAVCETSTQKRCAILRSGEPTPLISTNRKCIGLYRPRTVLIILRPNHPRQSRP